MNPNHGYLTAAGPVQTKLLIAIKNKMVLQGKNWAVTYGSATIPADAPAVTPDPKAAQGAALAAPTPSPVRLEAKTDGDDWNVALTTSERNNGLKVTLSDIDPANKRFTIKFSDNYIRYLGYYAIFYDAEGNKLSLKDWTPDGEDSNTSLTYELRRFLGSIIEYDDVQFVGYSSGVTTVLAVPTVDGTLALSITMPEGAGAAEFFGSGLGSCGC